MNKIFKWIKKNTGLFIILVLTLVLLVFIGVIFVKLLSGKSSDKYGNRLEGIEEVKISTDTYNSVKDEVTKTEKVEDVSVRLQGRIVYTTIVLKEKTSVKDAKKIASNTINNYSDEELSFYDFSFFLKWENEEGDKVITGNKHHDLDNITWVKS